MTIKVIRAITGMSQVAFAMKYEIPLRTLQSWETGERKPADYIPKLIERAVRAEEKAAGKTYKIKEVEFTYDDVYVSIFDAYYIAMSYKADDKIDEEDSPARDVTYYIVDECGNTINTV